MRPRQAAAAAAQAAGPGWLEAHQACSATGTQAAAVGAAAGVAESGAAAGVPPAADQVKAGLPAGLATAGHFAAPPCRCRCRCPPQRWRPRSHSKPTSLAAHHWMYITDCASDSCAKKPLCNTAAAAEAAAARQQGVGGGTPNPGLPPPMKRLQLRHKTGSPDRRVAGQGNAWLAWRRPRPTRCSHRCIKR